MPHISLVLAVIVSTLAAIPAYLQIPEAAPGQRAAQGSFTYPEIPEAAPDQEAAQVSFNVASVDEDPARNQAEAGRPTMAMRPTGEFSALNVTLRELILVTYDVRPYQIVGGPEWIGNQFFDIVAKAPEDFEMGHTKAMMRRLLEDRFGLVVHKAVQPVSVYALEWIDARRRPGPWLRRPSGCDRGPADPPEVMVGRRRAPSPGNNEPGLGECQSFWGYKGVVPGYHDGWFHARRSELSSLAGYLSGRVEKPVFDETRLKGLWDVDLKFDPRLAPSDTPGGSADIPFGSIFTAVREQLGLKLELTDTDAEALVIEAAQRPTPTP